MRYKYKNINSNSFTQLVTCILFFLSLYHCEGSFIEPCTGESPDACGFLPSTYAELGIGGTPAFCMANCTLEGGYDLCGVCGGIAPIEQRLFEPLAFPVDSKIGGSVANWNGSIAVSQHINQVYRKSIEFGFPDPNTIPLVQVPIATWTRDESVSYIDLSETSYQYFVLPIRTGDLADEEAAVRPGAGYALVMSEHYLIVGSHDSTDRELQLWLKTTTPPWTWSWTANDPCPHNRFGFSVGVDERIPKNADDGVFGVVSAGDPGAFFSGRVYIYFSYSPGLLQTLFYGNGNETELACFGHAVDADSGFLIVGAPALDYGGQSDAGSAFLFRWDPSLGIQGMYTFVTQIAPPSPVVNGGFGLSVAVYDCWLLIGDNQGSVYMYKIGPAPFYLTGLVPLEQPLDLNLETRFGNTVSIWGEYAAAGDEEFVPEPTAKGSTFVWDKNPLLPTIYRLSHRLDDPTAGSTVNTRYGADVDLRGGCFLAVGVTAELPHGGAYVVDLCRDHCLGCDGVLNSCSQLDACGVCLGDNSTCTDCNGVLFGEAMLDDCGVCEGTNTTCVSPYSEPAFLVLPCDNSTSATLRHTFEDQHGAAEWEVIAPFPTKGTATISNSGSLSPLPTVTYEGDPFQTGPDLITIEATVISTGASGVLMIPVSIGVCVDCFGVVGGPAAPDLCGVCNGDNSTCLGCDGIPNSGLVFDYCGVCGGDNSTCIEIITIGMQDVDCTAQILFTLEHEPSATPVHWEIIEGPFVGTAHVNLATGTVIYQNGGDPGVDWFVVKATSMLDHITMDTANITFLLENCTDCSGAQYGTQLLDLCGVCGGNSLSCIDCQGVPNGPAVFDVCGVCNGDGTTCLDCLGVPFGGAKVDACGVCAGDNSTCQTDRTLIPLIIGVLLIFLLCLCLLLFLCRQWRRNRLRRKGNFKIKDDPKPRSFGVMPTFNSVGGTTHSGPSNQDMLGMDNEDRVIEFE
jgi:hypothetical protein